MTLKLGLLLLILPPLALMGFWGMEYAEVSRCIQQGGSFDYPSQTCLLDQGAGEFIPFAQRYPTVVSGSLWAAFLGLLLTLHGLYRRRQ